MYVSKLSLVLIAAVLVGACATKPAPDFGGRWKHVNHFDEAPTEIPLYTSYTYQATPMDGTLKTMLERWAADSNMQLSYNLPSDYTLIGPVSAISTTSVQQGCHRVERRVRSPRSFSVGFCQQVVGPAGAGIVWRKALKDCLLIHAV